MIAGAGTQDPAHLEEIRDAIALKEIVTIAEEIGLTIANLKGVKTTKIDLNAFD